MGKSENAFRWRIFPLNNREEKGEIIWRIVRSLKNYRRLLQMF